MTWIAGEAGRNVSAGTTRALRYALALAVILCVCAVSDVVTVRDLVVRAQEYRDSGAAIVTIEAPGLVDGRTCDSFADLPGVRAAGAIGHDDDPLVPAALPSGSIASVRVSPGAPRLFHAEDSGTAGVFLSRGVLDALGGSVRSGDLPSDDALGGNTLGSNGLGSDAPGTLRLREGSVPVRGWFEWPDDGRRPGFSYAALSEDAGTLPFDECWVDAWPAPGRLTEVMRTAVHPDPTGQIRVIASQVNTTRGRSFDGSRSYAERVTRYAPYVALGAGLAIGYVSVRSRRLELAAAQHVGVGRVQQAAQVLLEASSWVIGGGLIAAGGIAVAIATVGQVEPAMLVRVAAHAAVPGLAAALLGCLLAALTVHEHHLFRYFKTR